MTIEGDYEPSALRWVRDQVEEYEASGGTGANTLRDTGIPVIIVTMQGAKSGKVRKIALMRVEHEGEYALVASYGGAPAAPVWYHNLMAHPDAVQVQDGPRRSTSTSARPRATSGRLVGAGGRRVPQLRRVPGEDRPPDPGARRQPPLSGPPPSAAPVGARDAAGLPSLRRHAGPGELHRDHRQRRDGTETAALEGASPRNPAGDVRAASRYAARLTDAYVHRRRGGGVHVPVHELHSVAGSAGTGSTSGRACPVTASSCTTRRSLGGRGGGARGPSR